LSNSVLSHDLNNLTLITGGARSGKSAFAESLVTAGSKPVVYIATMEAVATDAEVTARITQHLARRPSTWMTIEAPKDAHDVIIKLPQNGLNCIFDCLSLYVSNLILESYSEQISFENLDRKAKAAINSLLQSIDARPDVSFFVVSNEVGSGIVPENQLSRVYRDILGVANQHMARCASEVWLSCVGLQLRLKPQNGRRSD
jgi:adenosylcobinamide kinase/adenosylcobinamide-phosphate guanylyltransferase